jgi:hypothetical protein
MGSINSRPLKAYVRFDGSGRIVAGSLILRKNKPKVGKWKEIQAYECCNVVPTTTTTSTSAPITTSTTTVAPTTTTTTTVEPVTNLFIFNTSTGGASVSALIDNSGPISLTNQNGNLPVLASQTMDAIHGATAATPRATISGTGTITFQILLNGNILNVGTVSIPTDIGLTAGNVPLLATDVVRITLYNPTT